MDEPQVNLTKVDYADRQLVVVRSDDEVHRARQAALQKRATNAEPDKAHRNAEIAGVVLSAALPIGIMIANLATRWWLMREQRRELAVLPIARSEARQLRLPAGHPLYDVVYVGNPAVPDVYYPLAEFHRQTFAHKFGEAITLVSALGANSMRVAAVHGWSREFASELELSTPIKPVGGEGSIDAVQSGSKSFLYAAELKGSGDPLLPRSQSWYHHEPEWQAFAQQRIDHDLREFTLHVRYEEDFSIGADLAAKVIKVGLKTGGSFQRHESTTWAITATFPPTQSRALRAVKHAFGP
jgi:hypothetical protein